MLPISSGGQHYGDKGRKRDELRTKGLNKFGVEILRFNDVEILTNIEGVYETIKTFLDEKRGNPPHLNPPQWGGSKEEKRPSPPVEERIKVREVITKFTHYLRSNDDSTAKTP